MFNLITLGIKIDAHKAKKVSNNGISIDYIEESVDDTEKQKARLFKLYLRRHSSKNGVPLLFLGGRK